MAKTKFITIDRSESRYSQFVTKIIEFINTPEKDGIKLRAFNPYRSSDKPMLMAAWENGTLVIKDPNYSRDYWSLLYELERQAKKVISEADIHKVEKRVTVKHIKMGCFLSTFKA